MCEISGKHITYKLGALQEICETDKKHVYSIPRNWVLCEICERHRQHIAEIGYNKKSMLQTESIIKMDVHKEAA